MASSAAAAAAAAVPTSHAAGALPLEAVVSLERATGGASRLSVLVAALAVLHFRYAAQPECDVRLRVAREGAAAQATTALPVLSCTIKRNMTLRDLFAVASMQLRGAVTTGGDALGLGGDGGSRALMTTGGGGGAAVEFHQLMSAELASSGFQHICHVVVEHAAGDQLQARYEFPTMQAPGQGDPRLRVQLHLPCILSELARLAGDEAAGGLDQPLHNLQFLPPSERQVMLGDWSGLPLYDSVDRSDQLLQELFEETAARYPDRIAIECSGPPFRQMTYAQMARRTNQLARWMRNHGGVAVGSFVGMWMPRGMEVYIALIAILKAGASYVPSDPDYPSDRVNFILEDCQAPVLITHSEQLAAHPDFVVPPGCKVIEYDKVGQTTNKG
jgi:hypothetical protein